ncbi:RloB domain-containing protein [Escherichia coli]
MWYLGQKKNIIRKKKRSDPYDKVYCVFDRDAHPNYDEALSRINSLNPKGIFVAITSIPCFRVLADTSFGYTRKSFSPQKGKSEGAQMLAELKKYMPDYEKKASGVFNKLQIGSIRH